ncbi:MAG: tyrosine-type recombinase/integrase, partial [Nitrososphaerales archaeon]
MITFGALFDQYERSQPQLAPQTRDHERRLARLYLAELTGRRAQDITTSDVARHLRGIGTRFSPWTCVAVDRIMRGTFAPAVRRRILTRSPMDDLAQSEWPRQRNARTVAVLDDATIERLVAAASSTRWRAALALAGYAGLRIGELRALTWGDVDLDTSILTVRRSMLRTGTAKAPKTDAGIRGVPMGRRPSEWQLATTHPGGSDLVIATADGKPVSERNVNRALAAAKEAAKLDTLEGRLSMHSLRHSAASMFASQLKMAPSTLARVIGHSDPGFTFRKYARDGRSDA